MLATLIFAAMAHPLATQVTGFESMEPGFGTYVTGGTTVPIEKVKLTIRRDGTFLIYAIKGSVTRAGSGTWEPGAGVLNLRFEWWAQGAARGTGTVSMYDDQRWGSVSVNFENPARTSLRFKSIWSGEPYETGFRINQRFPAEGAYWDGNTAKAVTFMQLSMLPTGRGNLNVTTADKIYSVAFVYSIDGQNVTLNVIKGPDLTNWAGTGAVKLTTARDKFISASFNAKKAGSSARLLAQTQPPGAMFLRKSQDGSGTLDWLDKPAETITGVNISLFYPNKIDLRLLARPGGSRPFTGTFTRVDADHLRLKLDKSLDYGTITEAVGELVFDNRGTPESRYIKSIKFDGKLKMAKIHFTFSAAP